MTTPDLAGIIERGRGEPGHGIGYTTQAAADRRALLGLLRETREALERFSWGRNGVGECSWCRWIRGSDPVEGHAADCPMRAALAALAVP